MMRGVLKSGIAHLAVLLVFASILAFSAKAQCVSPGDDVNLTDETVLCPGTYYVDDEGLDGLIRLFSEKEVISNASAVSVRNSSCFVFKVPMDGAYAIDNDTGTYWQSGTGDAGEWIGFDLGKVKPVNGVYVYLRPVSMSSQIYDINLSTTGASWTTVETGWRIPMDGSWDYITFDATDARYVRLVGAGLIGASLFEVSEFNVTTSGTVFSNATNYSVRGSGTTIIGNGRGFGLKAEGAENVRISNMTLSNFSTAVYFGSSTSNNSVEDVTINDSYYGVLLDHENASFVKNATIHNCTYGVYLNYSNYSAVTDSRIWDIGERAVEIYGSDYANITSVNLSCSDMGLYILYSDNGTVFDVSSGGDVISYYMYLSDYWEFINASAVDDSSRGFYLYSADHNSFTYPYAGSVMGGFYLYADSDYNTVMNGTIADNGEGVHLGASATQSPDGNSFYYNNFTGNTVHANSTVNTNFFDTSAGGAFQGNWWDDAGGLDIYDTDGDGFGDAGTEYPYSSVYSSRVSVNVTDRGPATDKSCFDTDGDGAFNTSSDSGCIGYRDCDDTDPYALPPGEGLTLNSNFTLCSGTYMINDSADPGVLIVNRSPKAAEVADGDPRYNVKIMENQHDLLGGDNAYNHRDDVWLVTSSNWAVKHKNVSYQIVNSTGQPTIAMQNISASHNLTRPRVAYNNGSNTWLIVFTYDVWGASNNYVYGQRVSSTGSMLGGIFQIGAGNYEYHPDVAYNPDTGEWLVAWMTTVGPTWDQQQYIYGQRVSSSGSLVGDPFNITNFADQGFYSNRISVDYNEVSDEWVVVWEGNRSASSVYDLYAEMVNGTGDLMSGSPGSNYLIVSESYNETYPRVSCSVSSGDCLVSFYSSVDDNRDVHARVIDSGLSAVTDVFDIANRSDNNESYPAIGYIADLDEWLVSYTLKVGGYDYDLYGQRVSSSGELMQTHADSGFIISNKSSMWGADNTYGGISYSPNSSKVLVSWSEDEGIGGTGSIYGELLNYRPAASAITGYGTVIEGNGSGYGLFMSGAELVELRGLTLANYSSAAYLDNESDENIIFNMTLADSTYGIYLNSSESNNLTNSTFMDNTYGAYLDGSSGNLFYYNSFTGSSMYHAYSGSENDCFNTTVGGVPHGNWWDDILSLGIFDMDDDGFGDYGAQYPYNSSFSSMVSRVTDWGPVTTKACYDTDSDGFYNTSSDAGCPGYRDCDDYAPAVLPPGDDMVIDGDVWLCSGTYSVDDSGGDGLFRILGGVGGALRNITPVGVVNQTSWTGDGTLAIDNSTATEWTARGLGTPIWIRFDLGEVKSVAGINISVSSSYSPETMHIDVSNDTSSWYRVKTSWQEISGGGWDSTTFSETEAQHIRINVTASQALGAYAVSEFRAWAGSSGQEARNFTVHGNGAVLLGQGSGYGMYAEGAERVSISDIKLSNFSTGLYIGQSTSNNTVQNVTVNDSYYGVLFDHENNSIINTSTIYNCTYGIYLNRSNYTTVTNSTLEKNDYGAYINGADNNLFYYNEFYESDKYHTYTDTAGNWFNTTNGSDCGAQCARGNFWDDIESLSITDSNSDGFGDTGADYPYNSTAGNVSDDIVDWGPIVVAGGCTDADADGFGAQGTDISPCTYTHAEDCDDENASVYPPADGLTISSDAWLCNGTYYINDSGSDGVVTFGVGDVDLVCNGTTVVGNGSGTFLLEGSESGLGVRGCNVSGYSIAYYLQSSSGGNALDDLVSWNNTYGLFVFSGSNNVSGFRSYHDDYPVRFSGAVGNNMTGAHIYDAGSLGVRISDGANHTYISDLNMVNSSGNYELYITGSYNNTVRNSSFFGGGGMSYSVLINSGSGNLFYYNDFSGVYGLFAGAYVSGNHFNTTVGGKARGNYWGDILSLDIYDGDGDGFGETGPDYPYNSTNGGSVSVNVTDWGPVTDKVGCVDDDSDGFGDYSSPDISACTYSHAYDCDDDNASLFPPKDDLSITADTWLCNGTYYINDSGSSGVVSFGADSVSLECLGTTIVGNGSGRGILTARHSGLISGCNVSDYSYNYESSGMGTAYDNLFYNVTSWHAGLCGINFAMSPDNNISRFRSYHDSAAVRLSASSNCNVTDSYIYYSGGSGLRSVTGSDNNFFMGLAFINTSADYDILLNDSDGNTVRNCTVYGNGSAVDAIGIVGTSSGNLFYYNSISGTYSLFATSERADNHFNTTAPACAVNCSRGNYWGDILSLDIYDGDGDGFGDGGPEYPYNSTNGGSVNVNVTDWGPVTGKSPPVTITPSNATMVIYGPNGTVTTGTRNVHINISYNESDADKCRWANDDAAGLASADWEECTTVKAWILSGGEGNKTVFMEILHVDSSTSYANDSIMYVFTQDYTGPAAPAVYDGEADDIDWWNSNSTLHANWFNATDDLSAIHYKYRVINQTGCLDPSCAWTDVGTATEATAAGLNLYEGANYSFEVLAYVNSILNESAASNGTIIDLTRPGAPGINSSSHPDPSRPEDNATAVFNFSASDPVSNGVSSGIAGYSYLLDRHPGTAPDSILEERAWNTLVPVHVGSRNQTLKMNGSGDAYAVFSQLAFDIEENDSLRVRVALAERFSDYWDPMGVKVYLAKDTGGGVSFDMESDAVTDMVSISRDIDYAHEMTEARVYDFDLTVNETVDASSTDIYVVVSGLPSDDDNRQPLAVSSTADEGFVDNTTKSYVCDESDACTDTTETVDYAVGVQRRDSGDDWTVQYDFLGDAVYYFHAKAMDRAGNWGDPAHYKITVAAGGVSSMIYSPVDNEVFVTNLSETNVTVKVGVSGNTSAWVVALHPDGSNYTSSQAVFDSTYDFDNITLETGRNELYAVTNTSVGAMARSESVFVRVVSGPQFVTDRTLKVSYAGCTQLSSGNYLCYDDSQPGAYFGMGIEDSSAVSSGAVQSDTGMKTIKIFATRPFDVEARDSELEDDEFLDRVNPMFGYTYGATHYVIKNELRYDDVHLGGGFFLPPGAYSFYIRKSGVTSDGRYNVSLTVK